MSTSSAQPVRHRTASGEVIDKRSKTMWLSFQRSPDCEVGVWRGTATRAAFVYRRQTARRVHEVCSGPGCLECCSGGGERPLMSTHSAAIKLMCGGL